MHIFTWAHNSGLEHCGTLCTFYMGTLAHTVTQWSIHSTKCNPPLYPLLHLFLILSSFHHIVSDKPARPTVIGIQKGDIVCIVSHLHIARCTFCCRSSFWLQVETPVLKMRFHNNGCCPLSKLGCSHCQHLPL